MYVSVGASTRRDAPIEDRRTERANVATGSGGSCLESLGRALVAGSLQIGTSASPKRHTHWTEEVDPEHENTPRGQSSTSSEVLDFGESMEREGGPWDEGTGSKCND